MLRVVDNCRSRLLFFVIETITAFSCFMTRFLTIATRKGIAVAGRAGVSFAFPFCLALETVKFAFAFTFGSSLSFLAFVLLAGRIIWILALSSATLIAVSPPIHDGGRVFG